MQFNLQILLKQSMACHVRIQFFYIVLRYTKYKNKNKSAGFLQIFLYEK